MVRTENRGGYYKLVGRMKIKMPLNKVHSKIKISTLILGVLIFTVYTYKYHKIYMVYSYTIIKDRKKPQT